MKATPEQQALLLDLQALDTRLTQLQHRAANLPELAVLAEIERASGALRATLAEQQGFLENTGLELRRVEADVEVVETRIKRDSARLESSSSVKDVAALEQELAALRKRLEDLEEIQLSVMERAEEQGAAVSASQALLDEQAARANAAETARDAALATIEEERAEASASRRDLAASLPEDLLALYEKQRARYGTGASLLRGGVSLASGVALNQTEMQTVRDAAPDEVLICPSSDAILVRTAESGL